MILFSEIEVVDLLPGGGAAGQEDVQLHYRTADSGVFRLGPTGVVRLKAKDAADLKVGDMLPVWLGQPRRTPVFPD